MATISGQVDEYRYRIVDVRKNSDGKVVVDVRIARKRANSVPQPCGDLIILPDEALDKIQPALAQIYSPPPQKFHAALAVGIRDSAREAYKDYQKEQREKSRERLKEMGSKVIMYLAACGEFALIWVVLRFLAISAIQFHRPEDRKWRRFGFRSSIAVGVLTTVTVEAIERIKRR